MSPARKFLMEAVLKEIKGTKIKEVYYFLFSDLLIRYERKFFEFSLIILGLCSGVNKTIGESLVCKTLIPVEFLLVSDVPDSRKCSRCLFHFCTTCSKVFFYLSAITPFHNMFDIVNARKGEKFLIYTGKPINLLHITCTITCPQ